MKHKMGQQAWRTAFIKSVPILCSYLFVGMAYGMTMENAGFHWYYSLLISITVYTGAFQFVLITHAVNCSLDEKETDRHEVMFGVALLSKSYWAVSAVINGNTIHL